MSASRSLLLPAVITASIAIAQSSSASLVSIQDIEAQAFSGINGDAGVSHALSVPNASGEIHNQVNSVFELEADQLYARLMRLIGMEGGSGGFLGGPFSRNSDDEPNPGEAGTRGLFDVIEIASINTYASTLATSYSADFAKPGASSPAPYLFSTINNFFPTVGGGFSPVNSANSVSSDVTPSTAVAPVGSSAAAYQAAAPTSTGSLDSSVPMGPTVATLTSAPVSVAAIVAAQTSPNAGTEASDVSSQPISISVVPEPSTCCLLLGAVGLLGLRRRRA
jgi:hypothetical protein